MHYRLSRMCSIGLILALLFGLNTWLFQPGVYAQEAIPELPIGDFRLLFKEEFILEQFETQVAPFTEDLTVFGMTLSDPSIDFREGNRIDVSVTTDLPFGNSILTVRPTVTVAITAANNQLELAVEEVVLEGMTLPAALLGPQLESVQEIAQAQINDTLLDVERLGGLELVYIGTTEDLLILDFNFNLLFYNITNDADIEQDEVDQDAGEDQ